MITSKKQKLIKSLKTLKESKVTKEYQYVEYGPKNGPKKQQLFCFNAWMYKSLYPKTSFTTLMHIGYGPLSKALTEDVLATANITHYEYIHKMIDFQTAIKLITEEINAT